VVTLFAMIGARALESFSPHGLHAMYEKKNGRDGTHTAEGVRIGETPAQAAETLGMLAVMVSVTAIVLYHGELQQAGENGTAVAIYPWNLLWPGSLWILAVLTAAVWVPQTIARLWATPIVYFTLGFWQLLARILGPFLAVSMIIDTLMHRLANKTPKETKEESFGEEILTIVSEGHREGLLEEEAREMIEGVIEFADIDVSEIMTPRTEMVSIPRSLSWEDMLRLVIDKGHSRIPVTGENRDDVVGILVTKDLLAMLRSNQEFDSLEWTTLLREAYFVPETKPIDQLLQEFQHTRSHMAIVLDEYGGVAGVVTLEDVIEEIVGEIIDEFDTEEPDTDFREIEPGVYETLGKVHVDEINEELDTELPEDEDFDTIAGLVFSRLGHIPQVGEHVDIDKVRLSVLEVSSRRIQRLRISAIPSETDR